MLRTRIITLLLILIIGAGCRKNNLTPASVYNQTGADLSITDTAKVPLGLPKHIAFGTEGDISDSEQFIKESEYQYQYLAGDIFSNGWATWNLPTGAFATNFLNKVGKMGKVPVFTYYNIVPAKHRFEDPGFTNMTDAEVMNKYFDDWKLLLQTCKTYGKKVIIHYEPDLFGYMQMYKGDAIKSLIKVGLSNHADVKGFSNDAKGLAQAIVSMRNTYAPNVILGWHASQWATGVDVIKGKHIPEEVADETAAYYNSLNAKFDITFSEFADRDAGYDILERNKPNAMWSTAGNTSNFNMSDFDRFQRFLKRLNLKTGHKTILWQIPIGNTLTNTCNNTAGHYKDNRAEYFLQPVMASGNTDMLSKFGKAGVIAFLFGRGDEHCTSYFDKKSDGTTGMNETIDDDGGYLRKAVKAYYQNGAIPLL